MKSHEEIDRVSKKKKGAIYKQSQNSVGNQSSTRECIQKS
jgi:hypothetical protein